MLHIHKFPIPSIIAPDPRFPQDHRVTLHFEKSAQPSSDNGHPLQSPLVKIEPITSIAKFDSLENIDDGEYRVFVSQMRKTMFQT